jgi:hypothetical protein
MLTHYPYSLILIFSGILHEISMYRSICHVTDSLTEGNKEKFIIEQRCIMAIPFLVDGLWIGLNSSQAIPLFMIYFNLAILHIVNSFYKLTPVAFVVGLIVQTYCMASIQTY